MARGRCQPQVFQMPLKIDWQVRGSEADQIALGI
jgi:hypothetical protein